MKRKKVLKIAKRLFTLFLIVSWLFTGWPRIDYFDYPPQIEKVDAAAAEILIADAGTNNSTTTIGPGGSATDDGRFNAYISKNTGLISSLTVTFPANVVAGIASVTVWNSAHTVSYLTASSPTGDTFVLNSGTSISVDVTPTEYHIYITPKSHANMAAPNGASYPATSYISACTGDAAGGCSSTDSADSTVTIDNTSPSDVTATSATVSSDTSITIGWTTSASADYSQSIVLRWEGSSPGADVPTEGTTSYNIDDTIGSATVACVENTGTASTAYSAVDGSGSDECSSTPLSPGTQYSYKHFEQDDYGNWNTGYVNDDSPITTTQNLSPEAPTLYDVPFDNEALSDTTPSFDFSATDPDGTSDIVYEFQWDDDGDLDTSPIGDCESSAGSCSPGFTFSNTQDGGDTSPFTEGQKIEGTISSALTDNTTYYWRVRAKDVSGSNTYGDWSTTTSFTVSSSLSLSKWFQTEDEQFYTGTLINVTTNTDAITLFNDGVNQTEEINTSYSEGGWGSGTSAEGDTYNTYWDNSRSESLYGVSDLTSAGLSAGYIKEVALKGYETPGQDLINFLIRMKLRPTSGGSSINSWEGDWTDVYSSSTVSASTIQNGVWNTYTLDTPFFWNGTEHLILDLSRSDTAYTSGGGMYVRADANLITHSFSGYCDTCDPALTTRTSGTADGTSYNWVPSLKITIGNDYGTIKSTPIDFDWVSGATSWDTFDWSADTTNGSVTTSVYYSVSSDCDTIIPDEDLSGNAAGFTSGPIDISGLNTTTYNRICLQASLTADGGSPILQDWEVTWTDQVAATNFTLNTYRWYTDSDAEDVTDPWGSTDVAEDTAITILPYGNLAPTSTTELRLRTNFTVNSVALDASSKQFKLQFKEGTDGSCTTGSWTDVGAQDSAVTWRFANSTIQDPALSVTRLSPASNVMELYVTSTPSYTNPNSATVGQEIEYDFHIEHNNATSTSQYSFRVVESDNTVFHAYSHCPTLQTGPEMVDLMRHGNMISAEIGEQGFYWAN